MTAGAKTTNSQVKFGYVMQQDAEAAGYLVGPYLSGPYLAAFVNARVRTQVDLLGAKRTHCQVRLNIYNVEQLRVMAEFPSRGLDGLSWTVLSGGTAPGDFGVNNLNTDIPEQVYRSTSKIVILVCDTQVAQGVFMDTFALLNHNLTTSAIISLQGSNTADFSVIGTTISILSERRSLYYIEPTPPTASYRYWKLTIVDTTNTADYLQAGVCVFGPSTIIESLDFTDIIPVRPKHYADVIRTEGFTNVMNNRAYKRAITLNFEDLRISGANYRQLSSIFQTVLTDLKALWIPTPAYPSRYAVFGKLVEVPEETHNDKGQDADLVAFPVTIDESL